MVFIGWRLVSQWATKFGFICAAMHGKLGGSAGFIEKCHPMEILIGNSDSATRFYAEIINQIEIPYTISFSMELYSGTSICVHGCKSAKLVFPGIGEIRNCSDSVSRRVLRTHLCSGESQI